MYKKARQLLAVLVVILLLALTVPYLRQPALQAHGLPSSRISDADMINRLHEVTQGELRISSGTQSLAWPKPMALSPYH